MCNPHFCILCKRPMLWLQYTISWLILMWRRVWVEEHFAPFTLYHIDGLVQEICNVNSLAMELILSCTYPSIWKPSICITTYPVQVYQISCRSYAYLNQDISLPFRPHFLLNGDFWESFKEQKRISTSKHVQSRNLVPKLDLFTKYERIWYFYKS